MGRVYDALISWFEAEGWPLDQRQEEGWFRTAFAGTSATIGLVVQAREDLEIAIMYAVPPIRVPQENMSVVCEYLARANYGLLIGNFELDHTDGEVRYKTSVDVENTTITTALIQGMVRANCATADRYLPGLLSIIHGGGTAIEAIVRVEGPEAVGEA
jgi:hypothetical protein